ncbi:A-kinase anchor protein 10, mitochondrial-like isoform X1 [Biomphalaria glabrata]|uniref:A-kinase anchor protein 10, mitochondrial-like isoform X1 n=1 Tax=Biomphalaria glabrata TaxID=6526 RepID=A0A9U8E0D0_BIOGL|nr:A-kinase anchor protein 10, mitochondrial-like isoform X1 [Biomphalaria glabrata]
MPLFKRKTTEKPVKSPSTGSGLIRTASTRSSLSSPRSPSTPDSWGDESDIGVPYNNFNGIIPKEKRPRTLTLSESVLHEGPVTQDDSLESPLRTCSRLSKTLLEIVRDKDALSCFKAFLKSQMAEHLIQFWCEAESFHAATLMRLRTQSLQSISKSAIHKRRSDSMKFCTSPEAAPPVSESMSKGLDTNSESNDIVENILKDTKNIDDGTSYIINSCQSGDQDSSIVHRHPSCQQNHSSSDLTHHDSSCSTLSNVIVTASNNPNPASKICDNTSTVPCIDSNGILAKQPALGNCIDVDPANHLTEVSNTKSLETPDTNKTFSEGSQEDLAGKLKKSIERDAVTIFSTFLAKDAPQPIGVEDNLRAEAISQICKENGQVDPECFVGCQRFVLSKLESEYYQSFKDSEFHCLHQVNLLTGEKIYLPDILLNENALIYFMEFMEQEGASDLMQMWLAVDNFQQQLTSTNGSYDAEQAQADAMVIYDKYFSLQATNPIGFDDKMRFEIEGNICREGGPLPGCFTKAKNIVLKIIDKLYFSNYLQSQIYYRYLSDLICTVQMSEDMPSKVSHKGHKRTESDASSEHSVGSHSTGAESVVSRNTLLAVDTRKTRKGAVIEGDFSMNMDMLNPDDLWKRPAAKNDPSSITSNLILGSVNELGQFVSHFEPDIEAEKKKGPLLFKRRKEKEKEEEEMALRIAQMIISDVNTMTKTGETMLKVAKS